MLSIIIVKITIWNLAAAHLSQDLAQLPIWNLVAANSRLVFGQRLIVSPVV